MDSFFFFIRTAHMLYVSNYVNFRYGTEEDGWHGCNMGFTIYNEDGTPIQPEKTVVHKLNIDSGCLISGYCNTANTVSLEVVSKDNETVTLGDHFPGGEVSCRLIAYDKNRKCSLILYTSRKSLCALKRRRCCAHLYFAPCLQRMCNAKWKPSPSPRPHP